MIASGAANASSAGNVYIAQNAAGSANGSSCSNAYAYTFFNSDANWGSGGNQIGPGSTVHVCGTISNQIIFNGSGTSGSVITLLFEPGAKLSASATVWAADSPIWFGGNSYIVINGGVANIGGTSVNLEATDNGTGLAHQLAFYGMNLNSSHDVEITNFGCANNYVHSSPTDTAIDADTQACVYGNPLGANISIHNSTFHDNEDGILFSVGSNGTLNLQIYNNVMYRQDHSIFTSCGTSSSGYYVHDNHIHDPANWDTASNSYHHNGWIFPYYPGQICDQVYDYNNLYDGDWGVNNTSPIFFDSNGGILRNSYIYNDIFLNTNPSSPWGNGINLIPGNSAEGNGPVHAWNNTIICGPGAGAGMRVDGANIDFRNNVESSCSDFYDTSNGTSSTIAAMDYNYYANLISSGGSAFSFLTRGTNGGSLATQFSVWRTITQALSGSSESHSGQGPSAGLSASGVPGVSSPVIGAGTNLCRAISCTGGLAALASDTTAGGSRTPTARPATGAWDIGAYQYSGGEGGPAPPSQLEATPQ